MARAANLHDAISLSYCIHHREAVLHIARHRLVAVDVLPGRASVHHHSAMLMVGYRHDWRVPVLAVQDLHNCELLAVHGVLPTHTTAEAMQKVFEKSGF